jgi:hypothetical protein
MEKSEDELHNTLPSIPLNDINQKRMLAGMFQSLFLFRLSIVLSLCRYSNYSNCFAIWCTKREFYTRRDYITGSGSLDEDIFNLKTIERCFLIRSCLLFLV